MAAPYNTLPAIKKPTNMSAGFVLESLRCDCRSTAIGEECGVRTTASITKLIADIKVKRYRCAYRLHECAQFGKISSPVASSCRHSERGAVLQLAWIVHPGEIRRP